MTIYYIGGSPCSGKSTVAAALSQRFGLHSFKVDDHLERYLKMGAADGKANCMRALAMSPEQNWMREAAVQCEEELQIYGEIAGYVQEDLARVACPNGVITEGAAYLPHLARRLGIPFDRYISLTPSKAFQVFHYSRREWVPFVLEGCGDKARAFDNWMARDALFAEAVRQQCLEDGYASVVNDGSEPVERLIARVAEHFGLA